MVKKNYNPSDIKQHAGATYRTENGSKYYFTLNGQFYGRDSIEGIFPEIVAGLDLKHTGKIESAFAGVNYSDREILRKRKKLIKLVKRHGERPSEGKHLVLVLRDYDALRTERIGFKSSPLEKIV